MDPLDLAPEVERATQRLLATAGQLTDDEVRAPARLPGWSRGHVLTHLARSAEGAVNLLTWARTGIETPQYASWEQRNGDIEAGAPRPAGALLADVAATASRLAQAITETPASSWTQTVRWISGRETPAAEVVWGRLKEVEIHHVDLDHGYAPADWPDAFTLRLLRTHVAALNARPADPLAPPLSALLVAPDLRLTLGPTDPPPLTISGPAADLAGWLIGRGTGDTLTVSPAGPLPEAPVFA